MSPPSANSSPPSPRVAGRDHVINQDVDDIDDDCYFNNFPAGYRFCPHDHELILYYLNNKVRGQPLPMNRIVDVTLYQHNPEDLAEQYKHYGENEWYFFTPRDRKYRNGTRPNRAAGGGYWKATGADKKIIYNRAIVGYRKALVYYTGKAPKGDKTNWMMHEFRMKDAAPPIRNIRNDMRLDDCVLCRIYKKIEKPVKKLEQYSTRRYLRVGPNDHGDSNSGTDSCENIRQQQATLLGGFADSAFFCNSNSAAQVPILSETYMDPVPMFLCSGYSKGLQQLGNPPSLHFDLADTFELCESDLEAFNNLPNNLPAVDLRINPSPYTNSATSGLSTSAIDLADTFDLDDNMENDLEAFNNLSNNLPAVDLRINPSPYTNSATSGLSTSAIDLADTFDLDDNMENDLEALNNLSNNLPAVDLRINPSPYTNSATSDLSTSATIGEPKGPKLPQQLP